MVNVIPFKRSRLGTLTQIGEDWLYLALLGIIMALLSFFMDAIISLFLDTRLWLTTEVSQYSPVLQYISWVMTPILLVTFSTGFVHLCSPTAIGSGIPEMKTILRGVVLNEYLTFRTLIAKIVGLVFTLGSGLPLGKEGPFVHMASIVATLLSKLVASFQGIYENESRNSEMLSAACAVGVAATFYAPIGGVLFSIEVTTVYFAVRNYWRGFFAACCGATVWRLLGFWIKNDESLTALFKTNFAGDYPFDPVELLVFSFIGATSGLAGAAYIKFHREIVQFFRRHKRLSDFLQQNRFVYPVLVTLIITTSTFPPLIGKYTASTLGTHRTIEHLFSNRTWSLGSQDLVSKRILDQWTTPETGFHLHLVLYIVMLFWTSALASTIPIPSGLFIPVLKMGAAYGRLIGELMASAYPNGITEGTAPIVPGSYAVVGAAAFSGAVTHTISTSVILFEMTGQIVHMIPVILGVLIANAVCQSLQPSIYDSIIEIKKLPYLPPIASSNSVSHKILVKDFMNTNLAYVWKDKFTYADLKALLATHKKIISFPLVESPQSMKLLGSVVRPDLLKLLYMHLGRERRLQEVCRRNSDTLAPALQLLNEDIGRLVEEKAKAKALDGKVDDDKLNDMNSVECLELKMKRLVRGSFATQSSQSLFSKSSSSTDSFTTIDISPNSDKANDGDTTKIIISSAQKSNYGSTQDTLNDVDPTGNQVPDNLLLECQKVQDSDEDEEDSVAKFVDFYNRGTSMESDQLEKSIQEVEVQLDKVSKCPEVVLVLPADLDGQKDKESEINISCDLDSPRDSPRLIKIFDSENTVNVGTPRFGTKRFGPLKQTSSFTQVPPLNLRPTKSILKTSLTTASFGNTAKRNLSTNSFSSTFAPINMKRDDLNILSGKGLKAKFALGDGSDPIEPARQRRKVRLPRLRVVDMTPEEQEQWEKEQLGAHVDLSKCQVDEAPFQLVEQTSLYRVHTLFSMLGLNHAYVTSYGRLVGIVALRDIRFALEKMMQDN